VAAGASSVRCWTFFMCAILLIHTVPYGASTWTIRYRMAMVQGRRRLTAEDWAVAALTALGEGGLAAVAVEPLAARLGATKGSFYWHFPNREALIAAALSLWEARFTEATIAALAAESDARARLRALFIQVTGQAGQHRVEVNLMAAADHELVEPVLRRVVKRRIAYVVGLFEEIGFTKAEAGRRGALAYSAYVGHDELAGRLPGVLPIEGRARLRAYVDSVLDILLSGAPAA
jgi:AcrR family transcriptional regulator